jgi:predicted RNase H-like nuclease (RuvC/YqgF family)
MNAKHASNWNNSLRLRKKHLRKPNKPRAHPAEEEQEIDPEDLSDWELRALKQLEEDVETYRKRIRTLLPERDALQEKNAQLAHQLQTAGQPQVPISAPNAGGPGPASPNELQNRIAVLKQERAALEKARQEALQQLEDVRSGKALLESAVANMSTEAQTQEILALREQLEKAAKEIEQLKKDKELLSDIKKNESDNSERSSAVNDRTVQGLRRSIDAQSKAVSSLTRERDALFRRAGFSRQRSRRRQGSAPVRGGEHAHPPDRGRNDGGGIPQPQGCGCISDSGAFE